MQRLCCAMRWGWDDGSDSANQPNIKRAKLEIDLDNFDDSSNDEMPMTSSLANQNITSLSIDSQSLGLPRTTTKSNPFLSPGVLKSLMKNIEFPTEVKMLRPMCDAWNEVSFEELKERGLRGSIKPIKLFVGSDLNDPPDSTISSPIDPNNSTGTPMINTLDKFLVDTKSNPFLYRSFHLKYPKSLEVEDIKNLERFFSFYKPSHLELEFNFLYGIIPRFMKRDIELLNTFLDNVGWNLRELRISYPNTLFLMRSRRLLGLVPLWISGKFPILQKLVLIGEKSAALFREILSDLEVTVPNLTALEFDFIDTADLSIPRLFEQAFWRRGGSILTRLTHLDIGRGGFDLSMIERSSWILSLSNAGMKLKYFSMQIYLYYFVEEGIEEVSLGVTQFRQICVNLTEFFKAQAHSLVELCLAFDIHSDILNIDADGISAKWLKIKLPVFPALSRLEILDSCYMDVNGYWYDSPLDYGDSSRFPVLEDLTIFGTFDYMHDIKKHREPIVLKRLKMTGNTTCPGTISEKRDHIMRDVSQVEILEVDSAEVLNDEGLELPWTKSLKVLHVYKINKPLKLRHLKNLKTLVIEDDARNLIEWEEFDAFIVFFLHIRRLNLDLLKFRGFKMSEKIREAIVDHFPYRVEIVESPIIWNRYDIY